MVFGLGKKKDKEKEDYKDYIYNELVEFLKLIQSSFYSPIDPWYITLMMVVMGVLAGLLISVIVGPYLPHRVVKP